MWSRATLAVALATYAWSMMALELYLRAAGSPENALVRFRRLTMGRAVLALGAVAIAAAIVLAVVGRGRSRPAAVALVLCAAWIACLVAIWPI